MGGFSTDHQMAMNIFDLEMETGKWQIMGVTKPTQLTAVGAHMMQVSLGTIGVDLHGSVLVMAFKLLACQVSEKIHDWISNNLCTVKYFQSAKKDRLKQVISSLSEKSRCRIFQRYLTIYNISLQTPPRQQSPTK